MCFLHHQTNNIQSNHSPSSHPPVSLHRLILRPKHPSTSFLHRLLHPPHPLHSPPRSHRIGIEIPSLPPKHRPRNHPRLLSRSLYEEPSKIIPTILQAIQQAGGNVKHIVGNTAGGVIGARYTDACYPVEAEAVPALSVTLASLPDVRVRTFYWNDVPEFDEGMTRGIDPESWKRFMGMAGGSGNEEEKEEEEEEDPVFMIIPSPGFQNDLDDLLRGLQYAFPNGQTFGGIASTVSSLSRARIFAYSAVDGSSAPAMYGNGCVGVAFSGDIRVDTMIAQGAKPVGGVYRVVAAGASTPIL
eukprot:CCRYP_000075-RA/>CCRYP_000075-RA protein AED:0.02 eAED:0.02 QI:671/1/1/1/0/1/2/360/299